jgi:tRNA dimethylallyltransferase
VSEFPAVPGKPFVVGLFGPTGVGKTGVAIELAELIEGGGGRAVAVNCDSMQVYDGLQVISGAPSREERRRLEHRLVSHVPIDETYSAGSYSEEAHREIDSLLREGVWPLVVGGTGLYLRAALSQLELRPEVPRTTVSRLESEYDMLGPAEMHSRLPDRFRDRIHPNDRKRVLRYLGLIEIGAEPHPDSAGGGSLWSEPPRVPTALIGLTDSRKALEVRVGLRVDGMFEAGASQEARRAVAAGISATARKAIGFDGFLESNPDAVKRDHLSFGRRQRAWMRRMEGVRILERGDRTDRNLAAEMLDLILDGIDDNAPSRGAG